MLRYLTAGESHGPALSGILEGLPKGIAVAPADFSELMNLRWQGYGRGGRRTIEGDEVEIVSGVRFGKTLGTPVGLLIRNRDFKNWADVMSPFGDPPADYEPVTCTRPGHADLPGAMKFRTGDLRDIIERASARETAMRVALSVIPRNFLQELAIESVAFVRQVGHLEAKVVDRAEVEALRAAVRKSGGEFLTPDPAIVKPWRNLIDTCREAGETLGGMAQILVKGLPAGIGTFVHWDRRLDGILASALMSIPGVRAVEIGDGLALSRKLGSEVRDEVGFTRQRGFFRTSNVSGGLEGGMTTGEPLAVRVFMKPLPTIRNGRTLDIRSKKEVACSTERSDTCALPALALVAESVVLLELTSALLGQFGGDTLEEIRARKESHQKQVRTFPPNP